MLLSVIVPAYNEQECIAKTYEALKQILKNLDLQWELIFVDDCSKDNTLKIVEDIANVDCNVKFISFSRNFGKESAMLAGLRGSEGDAAIIIDADLQHPPELISQMVEYFKQGYHQVIAQRNRTGDSKTKTIFSKLYYKLVNHFVDVKMVDGVGDFRLLSRQAVNSILLMSERNRFSKGLFSWIGYKQKIISYENQVRVGGESKWSMKALLNYGIDGVMSFNSRPLRFMLHTGLFLIVISILYVIVLLVGILLHGIELPGYFSTIFIILVLGGIQLISIGIVGEYVGKIYSEVKQRPHYIIEETNIKEKE